MSFPLLYLLRHGQTEWNAEGRFQGQMNSPLTQRGHNDAREQGRLLGPIMAQSPQIDIFASPQGRVQQTVEIALAQVDRTAQLEDDLKEISSGVWEGKTLHDIEAGWPDLFNLYQTPYDLFMVAPGGEGYEALHTRCSRFLARLTAPAIVFTHGTTMNVLRGILLDLPAQKVAVLDHRQGCVYRIKNGIENILD